MAKTSTEGSKPVIVPPGEGEARWWFSSLAVMKATADDTGGHMTIVEMADRPDEALPAWVSHRFDLTYWILEGEFRMDIDGQAVLATPETLVYVPRGCPHSTTSGPAGCRYLLVVMPGGFEELARTIARPAETPTLPPDAGPPIDGAELVRIVGQYGFEPWSPATEETPHRESSDV
jgi:mannose-6-phosphate isomerase-like protein (cupin superfamily)